jgi:hypothetical protein
MDGWLPPRAPGANPPPRFDAPAPPADADAEPADADAEPAGADAPPAPQAPSGWQPPSAPAGPRPPDPPHAAAAPPPADVRPSPRPAARPAPYGTALTTPNPAAVWALVLGITGLVLLLLSLGTLFLLTLPCSGGAWLLARRAFRRIERGESGRGAGQATAALWLGRIGVAAGVVAMIAFIVLTATGFDFEALRDDLERDLERRRDAAR